MKKTQWIKNLFGKKCHRCKIRRWENRANLDFIKGKKHYICISCMAEKLSISICRMAKKLSISKNHDKLTIKYTGVLKEDMEKDISIILKNYGFNLIGMDIINGVRDLEYESDYCKPIPKH